MASVEREGVERRAEGLVAYAPRLRPGLGERDRRPAGRGVLQDAVADREPCTQGLEPAVRDPAVEVPLPVARIPQHHDATLPQPLVQDREVARREPVRRALGLAPAEHDDRAVALQVLASEMGIEAAILDGVADVMPGPGGALQYHRVRERRVEQQQALRLAGREQQEGDRADDRSEGWDWATQPAHAP